MMPVLIFRYAPPCSAITLCTPSAVAITAGQRMLADGRSFEHDLIDEHRVIDQDDYSLTHMKEDDVVSQAAPVDSGASNGGSIAFVFDVGSIEVANLAIGCWTRIFSHRAAILSRSTGSWIRSTKDSPIR